MHALSNALEICTCALETCVTNCTDRMVRLFFIFEARSPQGALGHVTAPELSQLGGEVRSYKACGSTGAHLSWEVRSGAIGHMAVPEPTSVERRGPEP
jgi:hypothetical protein